MRELVKDFPGQLKEALAVSAEMRISEPEIDIFNIVIVGMGGSGIGANLVRSIVLDEATLPIHIVKTYDLPNFVSAESLVICSSFSGNTEETLSAYHQAKDVNAKVLVITSGGQLKELADNNGDDLAILPGAIKSPRANLGYSVVQLLFGLEAYGFISDSFKLEIENSITLLNHNQSNTEGKAKELAASYHDKLPIFYSGDRFSPVIIRSQQQINENGKHLCHVNFFPEFNHNELVGWVFPTQTVSNTVVTIFHSEFDHAQVKKRMAICKDIFTEKAHEVLEVNAKGSSFLEQAFYIIHLFDFVSLELAELNQVDPTPVEMIDMLKSKLAN